VDNLLHYIKENFLIYIDHSALGNSEDFEATIGQVCS
jgi:hypothetical protein